MLFQICKACGEVYYCSKFFYEQLKQSKDENITCFKIKSFWASFVKDFLQRLRLLFSPECCYFINIPVQFLGRFYDFFQDNSFKVPFSS